MIDMIQLTIDTIGWLFVFLWILVICIAFLSGVFSIIYMLIGVYEWYDKRRMAKLPSVYPKTVDHEKDGIKVYRCGCKEGMNTVVCEKHFKEDD